MGRSSCAPTATRSRSRRAASDGRSNRRFLEQVVFTQKHQEKAQKKQDSSCWFHGAIVSRAVEDKTKLSCRILPLLFFSAVSALETVPRERTIRANPKLGLALALSPRSAFGRLN